MDGSRLLPLYTIDCFSLLLVVVLLLLLFMMMIISRLLFSYLPQRPCAFCLFPGCYVVRSKTENLSFNSLTSHVLNVCQIIIINFRNVT